MPKTSTLLHPELSVKPEELMNFVEEDFKFEPSQHIVDTILRYSQSLEIRKSSYTGLIENVCN
jgi:hypothetical protein